MSITELTKANEFQYQCSLLFNSSTGTCTETTDLMTLTVGDYPTKPNDIGFEFCQAEKSPKIELYEPSSIDVIGLSMIWSILELSGILRVISPSGSGGKWMILDLEFVFLMINRMEMAWPYR